MLLGRRQMCEHQWSSLARLDATACLRGIRCRGISRASLSQVPIAPLVCARCCCVGSWIKILVHRRVASITVALHMPSIARVSHVVAKGIGVRRLGVANAGKGRKRERQQGKGCHLMGHRLRDRSRSDICPRIASSDHVGRKHLHTTVLSVSREFLGMSGRFPKYQQ